MSLKYTKQEQIQEIMIRSKKLRHKKEKDTLTGLSTAAVMLFCLLIVSVSRFGIVGFEESRTVYGSFLLSAETGGYVLTAVIAFVLGAIVTAIIYRYKSKENKDIKHISHT